MTKTEKTKLAMQYAIVSARLSELERAKSLLRNANNEYYEKRKRQLEDSLQEIIDKLNGLVKKGSTIVVELPSSAFRRSTSGRGIFIAEDDIKSSRNDDLLSIFEDEFNDNPRSSRRRVVASVPEIFEEELGISFQDNNSEIDPDVLQYMLRSKNGILIRREE